MINQNVGLRAEMMLSDFSTIMLLCFEPVMVRSINLIAILEVLFTDCTNRFRSLETEFKVCLVSISIFDESSVENDNERFILSLNKVS